MYVHFDFDHSVVAVIIEEFSAMDEGNRLYETQLCAHFPTE